MTITSSKPLIVDRKMRRFWVLIEKKDGTMWANRVSAEYSVDRMGDYEVDLFTSLETAERAAAHEKLDYGADLVPVEVEILAKERR